MVRGDTNQGEKNKGNIIPIDSQNAVYFERFILLLLLGVRQG